MKNLLMAMCIITTIYLSMAFIVWDLNAGNWNEGVRAMTTLFAVFGTFIWLGIKHEKI